MISELSISWRLKWQLQLTVTSSEDDKETWLSIEEFKTKHADLLHLTYNEAVDISLKEIEVMKAVDEPLWEELDRKREEYIRIHGEVELDDEEE